MNTQQSCAHWLRADELTEGVRSLDHAAELLEKGRADAYQLKWALHALQLALQNFIFTTLDFGDRQMLDKKWWKKWWKKWDLGLRPRAKYPENDPRVNFRAIYKYMREKNPNFKKTADPVDSALMDLVDTRNKFEHMNPVGWSIEAALLREDARAALLLIRYLVCEHKDYMPILWPSDEERTAAIQTLERAETAAQPVHESTCDPTCVVRESESY